MKNRKPLTYRDAGVDIDAGNRFVQMIRPLVKKTFRPEVRTEIGGFGGLFSLHADKYQRPTLVAATDGVGTKLKIAFLADRHETIGIDLVAMCVNDIVVQGAEPLFFLDYFATGKLSTETAVEVVRGIAEGCLQAGCALIGGETAEMPGMYGGGEYDLAGFAVGVVDDNAIIDGSTITVGDRLIGIRSNGLHSNGYSLVRKILLDDLGLELDAQPEGLDAPLADVLLTPTRIYAKTVLNLLRDFRVKGIAHITGGGLTENVPRVLPRHCQAVVDPSAWERERIFTLLQEEGGIEEEEMLRTFNCGIGMVLVVPEEEHEEVLVRLTGLKETAWLIGEVVKRSDADPPIVYT